MAVNLSPLGGAGAQFFSNNGVPLAGGLLYTYQSGTTTPATTYTSNSGTTPLANPIVLDAAGRVPTGEIWLTDGINYKFVLKDSTDALIATWDGLSGINSNFIAYSAQQETATATQGQTVFTTTLTYLVGTNNLAVFVNGSKQIAGVNYTETDGNTVTFVSGLNVGDVVQFSTASPVASNVVSSDNVQYTPPGAGGVLTNVQTKLREYITFQDFGAVGDGVTDDTDAVQAAISYACSAKKAISALGGFLISDTITFPTGNTGCAIIGQNRNTYFKFTGTGALFSATSTSELEFSNLTLVGPGSTINSTAISCQTNDYTKGVYYNKYSDLTIEGFMYGLDIAGLCNPIFINISMGLAKSGIFTGTDAAATPLIGIVMGTTLEECVFNQVSIFAKQRCVQQTTSDQIVEGLYFTNCTFDLSYNTGANTNQSCVYFESGQDIVFTGCWFTNTQKYGSYSAPFTDNIVRVAYNAGSINASLTSLKFVNNTFVGNGMSLQFGNNVPNVREIEFVGNVFRLWASLGKLTFGGYFIGFTFCSNVLAVYGDDVGGTQYNLPQEIINLSNVRNYTLSDNVLTGILPINNASAYVIVGDTSQGTIADNIFPTQNSLSAGSDVSAQGTNTDVVVLGTQQTDLRQLTASIVEDTYTAGETVASINTHLTKPRMAIVEVEIDSATITNPGSSYMTFEFTGQSAPANQYFRLLNTGQQSIYIKRALLVSGTVSFKVATSLQMVISDSASFYRTFKITFV